MCQRNVRRGAFASKSNQRHFQPCPLCLRSLPQNGEPLKRREKPQLARPYRYPRSGSCKSKEASSFCVLTISLTSSSAGRE
jgi:hypothetical protein